MTRICVLPVAGREDPTQMLMMQAVGREGDFEMRHGVHTRFFAATRSCLKYRPDLLYFDWIGRYHIGRSLPVTWLKIAAFWLDVKIVTTIFRVPMVWSLHNLHSHEQSANSRWEMAMQRFFARHVQLIRVFSKSAVARGAALLGVSPGKMRVIPVGNYVALYPNVLSPAAARARLGFAADDFVLLWLGSIRPYKGLDELISGFRRVSGANWRMVIAGKPFVEAYAREIAALASADARIRLDFKFIPEEELQVYYNAANAVALPFAEVENTASLVVAMGFRKPVVAPNLGVIGERLCRQLELVYEPGQLEAGLRKLAEMTPARWKEIGEANFEEVSRYSWGDLGKVFQEISEGS